MPGICLWAAFGVLVWPWISSRGLSLGNRFPFYELEGLTFHSLFFGIDRVMIWKTASFLLSSMWCFSFCSKRRHHSFSPGCLSSCEDDLFLHTHTHTHTFKLVSQSVGGHWSILFSCRFGSPVLSLKDTLCSAILHTLVSHSISCITDKLRYCLYIL